MGANKNLAAVLITTLMLFAGNAQAVIVATGSADANALVNAIVGADASITVSNATFVGGGDSNLGVNDPFSAGSFTNGNDTDIGNGSIGIDTGIALTSGSVTGLVAPVLPGSGVDNLTTNLSVPGDSDLDDLIPQTTQDATILEFDFTTSTGDLFFNFVFASEEYNEFVNSGFNDVFGFFLDIGDDGSIDENLAVIPGTTTAVAINNVNCGNPFDVNSANATNCGFYNNNDPSDGGPFFDLELDGFTDVFQASFFGLDTSLTHHFKIAIADAGDSSLDSAVFIEGGTFSGQDPTLPPVVPPTNGTAPEPATIGLLGLGLLGLGLRRRRSQL